MNDVIGLAGRGADALSFDFDDEMGASTCVGCGECVQACPTGALIPKTVLDETQKLAITLTARLTLSLIAGGLSADLSCREEKIVSVSGRGGPNQSRLCVKGRYGFDYIHHLRLTVPLIEKVRTEINWWGV